MVLFIAGNLLSAIAPDYGVMMSADGRRPLHTGRSSASARWSQPAWSPRQEGRRHRHHVHRPHSRQRARVPFGTLLGQAAAGAPPSGPSPSSACWRWPASLALVPAAPRGDGRRAAACAASCAAFRSGQVWLSIVVTVLGFGGMFGAFTYIAFTLTEVSGFAASAVPWLLILFGVGPVRRQHHRRQGGRPRPSTAPCCHAARPSPWCWWSSPSPPHNQVVTIVSLVLMGGFGFATVPGLQMRVMKYAGDGAHTGLRRQYRSLQRGQRARRLARRCDHHRRPGLHLAHLGGGRDHRSGPFGDGRRCRRGKGKQTPGHRCRGNCQAPNC